MPNIASVSGDGAGQNEETFYLPDAQRPYNKWNAMKHGVWTSGVHS
ncbi:MAG: hypothetical protein IPI53_09455 [Saprospiraceae bacterium]|nr:hypothetical protein [Saprospiraceae bacterium]